MPNPLRDLGRDPEVVVMKFGGTSVATPVGRSSISARVTEALEVGRSPVVVVSAMGRIGDAYATDTLLSLVDGLPGDPGEHDLLASVGEVISAVVVAHCLRSDGISAHALTGPEAGLATDDTYHGAAISEVHTGPLKALIAQGIVPVVCGFQGMGSDGHIRTLGRGGSDTTACAIGVALNASEVEIYTDVDGVMSADPRSCDSAEVLTVIRADELFQMAKAGSRVVHTPAAELALSSGLSVRVRNTYTDHPGTLVADISSYRPGSVATAVTHSAGVNRFRAVLPDPEGTVGHMRAQASLYSAMADAGVSLDMFTPAGDVLVFTVGSEAAERASGVLEGLGLEFSRTAALAKVTLVGAGMHGVPGVMARVARSLADAGVRVLQSADSHTTISVLVNEDQALTAVHALHAEFDLG